MHTYNMQNISRDLYQSLLNLSDKKNQTSYLNC